MGIRALVSLVSLEHSVVGGRGHRWRKTFWFAVSSVNTGCSDHPGKSALVSQTPVRFLRETTLGALRACLLVAAGWAQGQSNICVRQRRTP